MSLAGRITVWVLVAATVAFTLLRLFSIESAWPVVAALAYTPYAVLGCLVPLALAAALRAWRPLAVAGACALTLVALVLPRALPAAQPAPGGATLRVMAVNVYGGGGEAETVVELVRRHDIDLLAVLEFTQPTADALAAAGLERLLPYQELRTGWSVEGSAVYARYPLVAAPELEPESRFAMPAVRVQVPGAGPVEFLAVHSVPPVAGQIPAWHRELGSLPPATRDGPVRVLAGDFNATLDHSPLRDLIGSGYTDAADATGRGLMGTWRRPRGLAALAPPVQIDRVLVDSRAAVDGFSVHQVPGSDHRAVVARLTLPQPGNVRS